jgi:hypothetical protein
MQASLQCVFQRTDGGGYLFLCVRLSRMNVSGARPFDPCAQRPALGRERLQWNCAKRRLCLRFVAAVSASCSGDKSDKEESAGCFCSYGDCGLRLHCLIGVANGSVMTGGVGRAMYPV